MFSSLLFSGLSRSAGESGADDQMSRPLSSSSSARISAVLAMHDAEAANRSPILRPSTTADNKLALSGSDSVASIGSNMVKSPLPDTGTAVADENRAPNPADTSADHSMEDVFHTPIVAAGSDVSLKFAERSVSGLSQSVRVKQNSTKTETAEPVSLQVCRGQIEPLGVPVPSTYADAANLATQYPDVADNILALPLSPQKDKSSTYFTGSDVVVSDRHLVSRHCAPSPTAKIKKDAHTPSKPNWALAPDSSPSPNEKGGRRLRNGKAKEVAADFELCRRRSKGRGQSRGAPHGGGSTKYSGSSTDKDRTRARKSGFHSTRQSRAPSDASARDSRGSTSSRNVYDWPRQDNLSSEADTRSALHLAQVDALIKELQKSRGLMEISGSDSGRRTPNSTKVAPVRGASIPLAMASSSPSGMPQDQPVWIAGHDGVLRPGLDEQIDLSRLRQLSTTPSVFLPAGMQVVRSHPMQRDIDLITSSAPGGSSCFRTGPRRSPEPRLPKAHSTSFPTAFHGSKNRTPERTMGRNVGSSRTPGSQGTSSRLADEGTKSWRSARLSKNPSPASTRGPSPSPISHSQPGIGQSQRWPTLDEICSSKSAQ